MRSYLFKWKHYESDIIILCVRWYLKYSLSFRDLAEILQERGLMIHHSTIYRWVLQYSPVLSKNIRKRLNAYFGLIRTPCRVNKITATL
jgi:Transposase and inactivated derivatives